MLIDCIQLILISHQLNLKVPLEKCPVGLDQNNPRDQMAVGLARLELYNKLIIPSQNIINLMSDRTHNNHKPNCQVCGNQARIVNVGSFPIAGYTCNSKEESLEQPSIEMNLMTCASCGMVKYEWFDEAEAILDRLYSGHFSTYYFTEKMSNYMNWFVEDISERFKLDQNSTILELGCNSGRMLKMFKEKVGCDVLGVEPSKTFRPLWNDWHLNVINDYFGEKISNQLKNKKFDVILFRHVFEHIPSPAPFFKSVAALADNDTTIVIEVPYLKSVIEKQRVENISYSHLNYYTIKSINEIAKKHHIGIINYQLVDTDGGSIIIYLQKNKTTPKDIIDNISHKDVENLVANISKIKTRLNETINKYNKEEVVGYGAGAKGQHLLHLLELENRIDYVIDDTPELNGKYIPGTTVKICSPDHIENSGIKAVVNLIPTHSEAIREKVSNQYEFIDPIND